MKRSWFVAATVLLLTSACEGSGTESALRSSISGPAARQVDECEPWFRDCPEADWVRRVVDQAGFRIVGDTGSVFVVASRRGGEFAFWAMDPSTHSQVEPLNDFAGSEGYRLYDRIGGVAVYSDGDEWVWEAHRLNAWVSTEARPSPNGDELEDLVRATEAIAYSG